MARTLRIAVDFDGTVVDDQGQDRPGAELALRELAKRGHWLYLWTCRENSALAPMNLDEAVAWFQGRGIPLRAVNQNLPSEVNWRGRKLCADLYVDDRVVGGFPGWDRVFKWVLMLEVRA